jgi:hypothetical protein
MNKYKTHTRLLLKQPKDKDIPHHQTFNQRTVVILQYFMYKVMDAKGNQRPDTPGVAYYEFERYHGNKISRIYMEMQVELFNNMMKQNIIENERQAVLSDTGKSN